MPGAVTYYFYEYANGSYDGDYFDYGTFSGTGYFYFGDYLYSGTAFGVVYAYDSSGRLLTYGVSNTVSF